MTTPRDDQQLAFVKFRLGEVRPGADGSQFQTYISNDNEGRTILAHRGWEQQTGKPIDVSQLYWCHLSLRPNNNGGFWIAYPASTIEEEEARRELLNLEGEITRRETAVSMREARLTEVNAEVEQAKTALAQIRHQINNGRPIITALEAAEQQCVETAHALQVAYDNPQRRCTVANLLGGLQSKLAAITALKASLPQPSELTVKDAKPHTRPTRSAKHRTPEAAAA